MVVQAGSASEAAKLVDRQSDKVCQAAGHEKFTLQADFERERGKAATRTVFTATADFSLPFVSSNMQ